MRKILIAFPILLLSCSKGGDTTTKPVTPVAESAIAFSVDVDPGAGNILGVVGTSQAINVKVSSTLPTAGVTIAVTVTKDADNATVYTNSISSLTATNTINISGLTPGALSTALVMVTSKSTPSNLKSLTFKLAAK
jgi:hypothetical protein